MELRNLFDVGIEFEFLLKDRRGPNLSAKLSRSPLKYWQLVHDGSTETPSFVLNGFPIEIKNNDDLVSFLSVLDNNRTTTFGGEIISPILCGEDNNYQEQVKALCDFFIADCNHTNTDRASIHVHINVGDSVPLRVLKNLVKLALKYEPFLYKLGGFGKYNRGILNDFIFCRPIISPPAYQYNHSYYPVFSWEALLSAENKNQFFQLYHNSPWFIEHGSRYVPQRYVGMNFYSILIRNSIEFRYANVTSFPEYLFAWIKLCQYIVKTAYRNEINITPQEIKTMDNTGKYDLESFELFLNDVEISEPYRKILISLFLESPDIEMSDSNILTHVDAYSIDPISIKVSPLLPKSIRKVIPTNARDFTPVLAEIQNKVSRKKQEEQSLPDLEYVVESRNNVKMPHLQTRFTNNLYTTSSTNPNISVDEARNLENNRHMDTLFYSGVGITDGILPQTDILHRLNYLKRKIRDNVDIYLYPVFSIHRQHTFTYPRSGRVVFFRGKRISFELRTSTEVTISHEGQSYAFALNRTSTGSSCNFNFLLALFYNNCFANNNTEEEEDDV